MSLAPVGDVPPGVVTVTSTVPADSAGDVSVQTVADKQLTTLPGKTPKLAVMPKTKPVPEIVTTVPPGSGPALGLIPVMLGAVS